MNKRSLLVIVILLIAVILVFKIQHVAGSTVSQIDLAQLPLSVGNWKGKEVEVEDKIYEWLETKDVIMREYTDGSGKPVNLSIVYSKGSRSTFHPPEVCFSGGGFSLKEKGYDSVTLKNGSTLRMTKLVLLHNKGILNSWYWFSAGNRFVPSFYQQQIKLLSDALKGKRMEGALIRVSSECPDQQSAERAKRFIAAITPYLRKLLKK